MNLPAPALAVIATSRTPSSVVISNLAYLIGAVVLAIVITTVVAIHHRRPRLTEDDMDDFHRSLAALNPDRDGRRGRGGSITRPADTPGKIPMVEPLQGPWGVPVRADGSTPRRPSTRSKSG
jgi:hypothetical protein